MLYLDPTTCHYSGTTTTYDLGVTQPNFNQTIFKP